MTKPEPYILQEWMSMCERAGWAINSNCPLIEDEVILEMNKYIFEMQCRVSSLETIVSILSQQDGEQTCHIK